MAAMEFLRILCLFALLPFSWALKFDLQAHPGHNAKQERCIRNFVAKDTLVVVTATVGGQKGDGQTVNMHVRCRRGEECFTVVADMLCRSRMLSAMNTVDLKI